VPTRDRAELALAAVRSALSSGVASSYVVVSDNSTQWTEANRLKRSCDQLGSPSLSYVRPPRSMNMADHWNWAVDEAMAIRPGTHVTFLSDRWMFYADAAAELAEIVSRHPTAVISYSWDTVDDFDLPARVIQRAWSGDLVEVCSQRLLDLVAYSDGWNDAWQTAMPRPINAVIPVSVIAAVKERFGAAFGSLAPDYCFGFRCLDVVDSILHYDKPCLVDYALTRSTGANYQRGSKSGDLVDFLHHTAETGMNFAAPIPGVQTAWNTIVHEYCAARNVSGSSRFNPLDKERYLASLAESLELVRDDESRSTGFRLLLANGWQGKPRGPAAQTDLVRKSVRRGLLRPAVIWRWFRDSLPGAWNRWSTGPGSKALWLLFGHAGIRPPVGNRFRFRSTRAALRYALRFRRAPATSARLATLQPRVVEPAPASR
jgi:hypothetical protein